MSTITLVGAGHNRLRYLVQFDGGAIPAITSTGAASPDLLTDSLAGPVKQLARAFTNGLGQLPAGALTQAQARAIWLADDAGNAILGNAIVPRAVCRLTTRTGVAASWTVDANVDGQGHPIVQVDTTSEAGGPECYLDVETQGAIGI